MSFTAFNPLIDGVSTSAPTRPATDNNGGATAGAVMGPSPAAAASAADLQGSRPLTGAHNTPLHVAVLGIVAILLLWGLRKAGFEFTVAASARG